MTVINFKPQSEDCQKMEKCASPELEVAGVNGLQQESEQLLGRVLAGRPPVVRESAERGRSALDFDSRDDERDRRRAGARGRAGLAVEKGAAFRRGR